MNKHIKAMAEAAGITETQAKVAFGTLVDMSTCLYWDDEDTEIGHNDPDEILEEVWPVAAGTVVKIRFGIDMGTISYTSFIDDEGILQWLESPS